MRVFPKPNLQLNPNTYSDLNLNPILQPNLNFNPNLNPYPNPSLFLTIIFS